MDPNIQIVGFRIGRETYGLPISIVREIVRVPEITAVPNAPDHIEGVINLRGKILPVVDLRKRFNAVPVAPHSKNRIVVVEADGRLVGLIVSSASEVLRIPPADIEGPHNVFQEGDLSYVTGVAKQNGRLVILLDIHKILQRSERHGLSEPIEIPETVTNVRISRDL
jgi:purine-binding chemotaxis protein CheW